MNSWSYFLQQYCVPCFKTPTGMSSNFNELSEIQAMEKETRKENVNFGIMFDIDGVLLRGTKPIPEAIQAIKMLVNRRTQEFDVPCLFCTNAFGLRETKAATLSKSLNTLIKPNQVVMSQSPLEVQSKLCKKWCFVSGPDHDGGAVKVAQSMGFEKIVTVDDLRHAYPYLDWIDHKRWPTQEIKDVHNFPQIEAILLLGEPIRWETNLQLIIDILLTNGKPNKPYSYNENQIPIIAVNMDLHYMAKAIAPRFGHGAFLVCLEALYKKLSGHDLVYTALIGKPSQITFKYAQKVLENIAVEMKVDEMKTIYFIGDNPMTDVYGSNMYNKYINQERQNQEQQSPPGSPIEAQTSADSPVLNRISRYEVDRCVSMLVCTGVYNPTDCKTSDAFSPAYVATKFSHFGGRQIDHGHRDLPFTEEMAKPKHVVKDVKAAVEKIFELEECCTSKGCDS